MRATSIRHENRNGCKSNYQRDYYGHTTEQIISDFKREFDRDNDVVWAKLFTEAKGELILELSR
jgi:hypothetical protein